MSFRVVHGPSNMDEDDFDGIGDGINIEALTVSNSDKRHKTAPSRDSVSKKEVQELRRQLIERNKQLKLQEEKAERLKHALTKANQDKDRLRQVADRHRENQQRRKNAANLVNARRTALRSQLARQQAELEKTKKALNDVHANMPLPVDNGDSGGDGSDDSSDPSDFGNNNGNSNSNNRNGGSSRRRDPGRGRDGRHPDRGSSPSSDGDRSRSRSRDRLERVLDKLLDSKTSKCKITISGEPDEDLFKKVAEINRWMDIQDVSKEKMFRYLVTSGLKGTAKERYENQYAGNSDSVNTLDNVFTFLFKSFNADRLIDSYFKKVNRLQQNKDEDPSPGVQHGGD